MVEDVLAKAIAQRKKLAEEMNKLDAFISTYRRLQSGETQFTGFAPTVTITTGRRKSIETGSIDILREADETLPTKEILQRLSDRDIHVGGKDLINNLASILSRSKGIENISGRGWKLKSEAPNDAETGDASPVVAGEASNSEGLAG